MPRAHSSPPVSPAHSWAPRTAQPAFRVLLAARPGSGRGAERRAGGGRSAYRVAALGLASQAAGRKSRGRERGPAALGLSLGPGFGAAGGGEGAALEAGSAPGPRAP